MTPYASLGTQGKCTLRPVLFPDESITRKQHVVSFVLPKYIREGKIYKYMKILERKSENLHCVFNALERKFVSAVNQAKRFFFMLREYEHRLKTDISMFDVSLKIN